MPLITALGRERQAVLASSSSVGSIEIVLV